MIGRVLAYGGLVLVAIGWGIGEAAHHREWRRVIEWALALAVVVGFWLAIASFAHAFDGQPVTVGGSEVAIGGGASVVSVMLWTLASSIRSYVRDEAKHRTMMRAHWHREEVLLREVLVARVGGSPRLVVVDPTPIHGIELEDDGR